MFILCVCPIIPVNKGMNMQELIRFSVNGKPLSMTLDVERKLLWVLRTELGLTGAKYGCGKGICGACTVLVNNRAVRSCRVPVKNIKGKDIITIEGLSASGKLHPLQEAFMKHDAFQCGFCTPGMILTAYSFLQKNPKPSYTEVLQGMDKNLCRCGAHTRIVQAILNAAEKMAGEKV
jgi:aerobic-type carbon monoxide dehydrogenase small subunit (CoxS/CutS family)